MKHDILLRHTTLVLLVLVTVLACTVPAAAMDGKLWMKAYQGYLRKDYQTAHQDFAQLLQGQLTTTEKAEILWYDFCSLQELKRPADAAADMETLIQVAPNDPHFEGLAFLYRYYLDNGAYDKAEALWNTVVKQWGKTAGAWKLIAQHTDFLAQRDPDQIVTCAEQLAPLTIAKEDLISAFYLPLFKYGHFEKAKEVHELLQKYFAAHRPSACELDKRAYEDAISNGIVEAYFTNFKTALDAGDMEAARTWLANLNGTVPEHPRAVEARKLYREKINANPEKK